MAARGVNESQNLLSLNEHQLGIGERWGASFHTSSTKDDRSGVGGHEARSRPGIKAERHGERKPTEAEEVPNLPELCFLPELRQTPLQEAY